MQLISPNLIKLILLAYTCIGMHVALYSPVGAGLYYAFNMISWVFISIFIGFGFWNLSQSHKFYFTKLQYWVIAGVVLLSIPMFYPHAEVFNAFPRFIALIVGLLFLVSLYQLKLNFEDRIDLLYILLIGISLQALLGLCQFFIFDLASWKGSTYELLNNRPSGVFRQPNVMASLMATGVVLSLVLTYFKTGVTTFQQFKNIILYFCLFSCSLVLVLLQSKTGYLGLIIASLLFVSIFVKHFSKFKFPLFTIGLGILLGVLSLIFMQEIDRGENLYSDKGVRTDIITTSYNMFKDKPIEGYGYGKFERNYLESHRAQMQKNSEIGEPVPNLGHPHNEVLLWGVEGGVVGITGVVLIGLGFLLTLSGRFTVEKLALMALITPLLLHTQTELPFYLSTIHWLYFLVFIWFIDQQVSEVKTYQARSYLLARCFALIVPLITIPFMLSGLHTSKMLSNFAKSNYEDNSYLNSIVNHMIWNDYLQEFYNNSRFYEGLANSNKQMLLDYIGWASEYVESTPRLHLFENIILAINAVETQGVTIDAKFKEKILNDAKFLYPQKEQWGVMEDAIKLMNRSN